jgi:hypothetical protein
MLTFFATPLIEVQTCRQTSFDLKQNRRPNPMTGAGGDRMI